MMYIKWKKVFTIFIILNINFAQKKLKTHNVYIHL